jgi:hypothetical protein
MLSDETKLHLVKVCAILNSHEVDYIVVGGAAVSHYGYNRPSGIGQYSVEPKPDLDFWYNPSIDNFEKIIVALDDLAVDTADLKSLVFDKKHTFLKIPRSNFHMDFLPIMEGLDSFRECRGRATKVIVDDVPILIVSYDDLITNKRAVNRKIDQSDITELGKIRRKKRGKGI